MEEVRGLRLKRYIKSTNVMDENSNEASKMPEITSSIPFLPRNLPLLTLEKRTLFGEDHGIHNRLIGWSKIVRPKVDKDFKKIRNFRSQRCYQRYEDLEPWDETYFTGMMKSSAYNLDSTDYQHFSGTRVTLNLAETPSNLFEYYVWDYWFLRTFAKYYLTGEVIPEEVVESMKGARNMFAATELQRQVMDVVVHAAF
ncbi:hypothetical protein GIB67_022885 [Kingdonia uniflora]|uniref:Peptidase M3A/M3B catalytic domain-containing protein n=1 Tax=Kingdonia uniflora TaxID=39325 RepID=A0A7J7MWF2_9MAGN|nr:hypothetical protein GIB67_022885 [Kingdonia uniflora]